MVMGIYDCILKLKKALNNVGSVIHKDRLRKINTSAKVGKKVTAAVHTTMGHCLIPNISKTIKYTKKNNKKNKCYYLGKIIKCVRYRDD
tara:strand:- start:71 stop:337 length:267 start_codon:yes stop_codon:yes gene_type:complete